LSLDSSADPMRGRGPARIDWPPIYSQNNAQGRRKTITNTEIDHPGNLHLINLSILLSTL